MTRFDVARTQQPKSTAAYGSLRFGPLRYQLKRTIGMLPTPDNSECSRHPRGFLPERFSNAGHRQAKSKPRTLARIRKSSSHPALAAGYTNGRCRETGESLQSQLSAYFVEKLFLDRGLNC
ncbi:hypothetical protein [Tateyamaria sp.]|uniref:hypothetical protein n=1 Tax=Tateyamaria sp. TaxID=1929288 RepID=UPI003B21A8AD